MANDHYEFNSRDNSRSGGSGDNRHSKRHRTSFIPLPPVPPAQPSLLQIARQTTITLPVMDPEAMPAKQGLNEWGAFTGGGSIASKSGILGLGPLLFRHNRCVNDVETTMRREVSSSSSPPLTGRDLVEMDRLQRNDPVSFNPMQAISWARLDDDDDEVEDQAASPVQRETESTGKRTINDARSLRNGGDGSKYHQNMPGATIKGQPHTKYRDDRVAFDKPAVNHGDVRLHKSTPRDVRQCYSQNTKSPPAPTKHLVTTFSKAVMAHSDGHRVSVPPVAVSFSNPTQRVDSIQTQVHRQQRKHHHRHETQTAPTELYMRQNSTCPPPDIPNTSTSFFFQAPPHHTQHHHHQLAYTTYPPTSSSTQTFQPPSLPPPQQDHASLLLCLASSCQARFLSEAQLNAHYQAVHASSAQPDNGGRHQSYTPPSDSLACSWTLCSAGGFTSNNALMWHVKAEHLLQCPVPGCCDCVFPSKKQVEAHVRNGLRCQ